MSQTHFRVDGRLVAALPVLLERGGCSVGVGQKEMSASKTTKDDWWYEVTATASDGRVRVLIASVERSRPDFDILLGPWLRNGEVLEGAVEFMLLASGGRACPRQRFSRLALYRMSSHSVPTFLNAVENRGIAVTRLWSMYKRDITRSPGSTENEMFQKVRLDRARSSPEVWLGPALSPAAGSRSSFVAIDRRERPLPEGSRDELFDAIEQCLSEISAEGIPIG
jgi:hypothetical protein